MASRPGPPNLVQSLCLLAVLLAWALRHWVSRVLVVLKLRLNAPLCLLAKFLKSTWRASTGIWVLPNTIFKVVLRDKKGKNGLFHWEAALGQLIVQNHCFTFVWAQQSKGFLQCCSDTAGCAACWVYLLVADFYTDYFNFGGKTEYFTECKNFCLTPQSALRVCVLPALGIASAFPETPWLLWIFTESCAAACLVACLLQGAVSLPLGSK